MPQSVGVVTLGRRIFSSAVIPGEVSDSPDARPFSHIRAAHGTPKHRPSQTSHANKPASVTSLEEGAPASPPHTNQPRKQTSQRNQFGEMTYTFHHPSQTSYANKPASVTSLEG
ncbi:hypothetical protein DSM100238_1294 [Bifidobacterium apri]|uniref:Uncharacterized protein n=1 Tax=Bifidobacterium apri TaxID=1769423 RepID=A0A6A2VX90_9BIFI|nr:hypothetical protein DSM100238_1294 [Bifidobacterium apri]